MDPERRIARPLYDCASAEPPDRLEKWITRSSPCLDETATLKTFICKNVASLCEENTNEHLLLSA